MKIITKEGFTYVGKPIWFLDWFAHVWGEPGVDFQIIEKGEK